jgi:hypothetical protein
MKERGGRISNHLQALYHITSGKESYENARRTATRRENSTSGLVEEEVAGSTVSRTTDSRLSTCSVMGMATAGSCWCVEVMREGVEFESCMLFFTQISNFCLHCEHMHAYFCIGCSFNKKLFYLSYCLCFLFLFFVTKIS